MSEQPAKSAETDPGEIARERAEARTVDGKAMVPESIKLSRDLANDPDSGESGSQGNRLGRENQNPISQDSTSLGATERTQAGNSTDH